jgi:hypothetical protein
MELQEDVLNACGRLRSVADSCSSDRSAYPPQVYTPKVWCTLAPSCQRAAWVVAFGFFVENGLQLEVTSEKACAVEASIEASNVMSLTTPIVHKRASTFHQNDDKIGQISV